MWIGVRRIKINFIVYRNVIITMHNNHKKAPITIIIYIGYEHKKIKCMGQMMK